MNRAVFSLAIAPLLFFASGCHQTSIAIDEVAIGVEEFGFVTVSAPLLSEAPGEEDANEFAFDLKRNTSEYFSEAKSEVRGGGITSDKKSLSVAVQGSLQVSEVAAAKFESELGAYSDAQTRREQITRIRDRAARERYSAAVRAANNEPDEVKAEKARIDAKEKLAEDLEASLPSEPVNYPTASSGDLPVANAATKPESQTLAEALQVVTGERGANQQRSLSNRTAIITSAGDKAVEAMFRVLGNPGSSRGTTRQTAFFGVAMVSVVPGRITRTGYVGQVTVSVDSELRPLAASEAAAWIGVHGEKIGSSLTSLLLASSGGTSGAPPQVTDNSKLNRDDYNVFRGGIDKKQKQTNSLDSYSRAREDLRNVPSEFIGGSIVGLTELGGGSAASAGDRDRVFRYPDRSKAPTVSAVAPMTEVQALDLAGSIRNQRNLSLSLAAALAKAGQGASGAVFAAYAKSLEQDFAARTSQNAVVGFSTGEMFGYQIGPSLVPADPAGLAAKPERVLERQSFPVLLIFSMPESLPEPRIFFKTDGDGDPVEALILKSNLVLRQDWRWVPLEAGAKKGIPESTRLAWTDSLDKAQRDCPLPKTDYCYQLYSRAEMLRTIAIPSQVVLSLPSRSTDDRDAPTGPLQLETITPSEIRIAADSIDASCAKNAGEVILVGKNLDQVKRVHKFGSQQELKIERLGTTAIRVSFPLCLAGDERFVSLEVVGERKVSGKIELVRVLAPPLSILR